jgi:foldase protein PrsA
MATAKRSRKKTAPKSKPNAKLSLPKVSFNREKIVRTLVAIVVLVLAFALIDLFVQYLNNSYSVAVVNGSRIPKSDFYERLEKAYGAQAVSTLIDEELIEQEATEQGYTVSESDIDNRIKEIETELGGQDQLNAALQANAITMEDLRRQVRLDLLVRDVLEPTIEYTDEDVEEFFDQYKDVIYTDEEDVKFEDKKEDVTEIYLSQQIDTAKTSWLSDLRNDAKIQDNVAEKPSYGFLKVTMNIINNLISQAKN